MNNNHHLKNKYCRQPGLHGRVTLINVLNDKFRSAVYKRWGGVWSCVYLQRALRHKSCATCAHLAAWSILLYLPSSGSVKTTLIGSDEERILYVCLHTCAEGVFELWNMNEPHISLPNTPPSCPNCSVHSVCGWRYSPPMAQFTIYTSCSWSFECLTSSADWQTL